jgi:hypothetical protein
MAGLGIQWQLTFHVGETSTFEERYQTVLAAHPVPANSVNDVAMAHDTAVSLIASKGIIVPMDVFLTGWWDSDNIRTNVTVTVNQA